MKLSNGKTLVATQPEIVTASNERLKESLLGSDNRKAMIKIRGKEPHIEGSKVRHNDLDENVPKGKNNLSTNEKHGGINIYC